MSQLNSSDMITIPIENNCLVLFKKLKKILDNKYFKYEYEYQKNIQSIGELFEEMTKQNISSNCQPKIFLHLDIEHFSEYPSSSTFDLTYFEQVIKIFVRVKVDLLFKVVCMFSKQQSFVKFIYKTDIPYDWALELFKIDSIQDNNPSKTVVYPNLNELKLNGTSSYTKFWKLELFQDLDLTVYFPMGSCDKYKYHHDTSYYIQQYNNMFNDKMKQLSKLKKGCIKSLSIVIGWPEAMFDKYEPWASGQDQVKIQQLVLVGYFNRVISAHTLHVLSSIFGNVCLGFDYKTTIQPKNNQEFRDICEALMKFKQVVGMVLVLPDIDSLYSDNIFNKSWLQNNKDWLLNNYHLFEESFCNMFSVKLVKS